MTRQPAARRPMTPRLPAWLASVAVHALLLVMLLLALQRAAPRGAAEEATATVGIVLRRADAQGDPYQGPDTADTGDAETDAAEAPSHAASQAAAQQSALQATLPDASAAAAEFLPRLPGIGPQPAGADSLTGDAQQMTRGGAGRRRTAGGGNAVVQVFGVEGVGQKFVYAFDRSVSMGESGRLAAAKRQLIESLGALEATHQFQIIFFNGRTVTPDLTGGQNRVAFASAPNKAIAERFVRGVRADGGTDRYVALRSALAFDPDVVFFLTDADDPMSPAEMQKIDRRNRRVGATICTIEFGAGPEHGRNNFLRQLAAMTGGQYGYIDTTRLGR